MMSAVLIRAGEGKLTEKQIQAMLDARDKEAVRFNAPSEGLYLVKVTYDPEFAISDDSET